MEDGRAVEVGAVGREGLVNVAAMLGNVPQLYEAVVQVEIPDMSAQVMAVEIFRREMAAAGDLYILAAKYAQASMVLSMQSTACNGLHGVEQRCAKWLLMSRDRAGMETFKLTQEFLSVMLGVRRATVTVIVGGFQRAGLIAFKRKELTILSPDGLARLSCECYRIMRQHFARILPPH
jgi:CRP-like cAMP-binding protein